MQTIRTFSNIAEAGLACSVLKAAGIRAALADENAFTLGPQYVPWGIRLQVPEQDADEAERLLGPQEEFPPLTDDFVPRPEPSQESEAPTQQALDAFDAFPRGGIWAVCIFGVFMVVNLATGHPVHADPGRVLLIFGLGGIVGIIVRAIDRKGRKDKQD
jgi:Putative prokaryotic signal transducing protein